MKMSVFSKTGRRSSALHESRLTLPSGFPCGDGRLRTLRKTGNGRKFEDLGFQTFSAGSSNFFSFGFGNAVRLLEVLACLFYANSASSFPNIFKLFREFPFYQEPITVYDTFPSAGVSYAHPQTRMRAAGIGSPGLERALRQSLQRRPADRLATMGLARQAWREH